MCTGAQTVLGMLKLFQLLSHFQRLPVAIEIYQPVMQIAIVGGRLNTFALILLSKRLGPSSVVDPRRSRVKSRDIQLSLLANSHPTARARCL